MPLLTHIPGKRPIVLNDLTLPKTKKVVFDSPEIKPAAVGKKSIAGKSKSGVRL